VVCGVAAGFLIIVRELPSSLLGSAVAFLVGVFFTPLVASPFEWLVHRYVYHRRLPGLGRIYTIHHHSHHHVFFPTWRYVTSGPPRRIPIRGDGTLQVSTGDVENA
jgi:hypothetical protein